jgi:YfiH family protein
MLVLRSARLTEAGFEHAFALREAADADLRRALSVDVIVQVKQVHGARAVAADDLPLAEADAIVARGGRHVAVGVRVADCVPLLVGDEDSGDVAAIHAGWRGIVAGVVRAGIELLGGRNLVAAIGPCIGPCCFEVGLDVAAEIAAASNAERALSQRGNKAYADLRRAVRAQLCALGVADDRIDDVPGCTKHDAVRFHSYRRDGRESGRMLSAIATAGRRLSPP